MKAFIFLASAVVLGALPAVASADAHELELQLAMRNEQRERTFDEEASANSVSSRSIKVKLDREESARKRSDAETAREYAGKQKSAERWASRKTGIVLTTIGLGLGGIGAAAYYSSRDSEDRIKSGTLADGAAIQAEADKVPIKQGVAISGFSTAVFFVGIGAAFIW